MPYTRNTPVTHEDVAEFLNTYGDRYRRALKTVKDSLNADRRNLPILDCVYSVYSRGDRQGQGDELKNARKIRLKVNERAEKSGEVEADFLMLPDVVGLTIAVLFPTDVQVVASHIDGIIKDGTWKTAYGRTDAKSTAPFEIETVHGQPHGGRHTTNPKDEGYFACHFYVVPLPESVIVEIQIKTVLHDAWGQKTHDLTYKNSIKIGENVMGHFGSLGQTLGRLDQQSDYLRQRILSENAATNRKKRELQLAAIQYDIKENAAQSLPELTSLLNKIEAMSSLEYISRDVWRPVMQDAITIFDDHPNEACQALTALGGVTQSSEVKLEALERLDMWAARRTDFNEVVIAKLFLHIAHFAFDDLPQAIDTAENLVDYINKNGSTEHDQIRTKLRMASLKNSLAYYHAVLIGTDEGRKRSSQESCIKAMNDCLALQVELGSIESAEQIWKFKAGDKSVTKDVYPKLDTCLFVRIALATETKEVREALAALVDLSKANYGDISLRALDLHQHFAYRRLLELEAREATVTA